MSRSIDLYLRDITDALRNIEQYTADYSFEDFERDQKTIDAVIRNFEIMGEAAREIAKSPESAAFAVPWRKIIEMRNKISHEYFGIDLEIIWETIQSDLPLVKKELRRRGGSRVVRK